VVRAPESVRLDESERHVSASMWAMSVNEAIVAGQVSVRDQVLTEYA
jgi:hypothetical protein